MRTGTIFKCPYGKSSSNPTTDIFGNAKVDRGVASGMTVDAAAAASMSDRDDREGAMSCAWTWARENMLLDEGSPRALNSPDVDASGISGKRHQDKLSVSRSTNHRVE